MLKTVDIKKKIKKYLKLGYHKDLVKAYRSYKKKGDVQAKKMLEDHYAKQGKTIIWENNNFNHYLEFIQKGKV
jgi:hypothetical protein